MFIKILALNGSPRGKSSNSNIMVESLLRGFNSFNAETENIFLSEQNIQHCKGCYSCWFKTPGHCAIDDDVKVIVEKMIDSDIVILATPLYFVNISGILKMFVDRLTVAGGDPHKTNDIPQKVQKYIMVSNCGFPDKAQFEVVSLWINKMMAMMKTELISEIYTTNGRILTNPSEEQMSSRLAYISFLEKCGSEIAQNYKLKEETKNMLTKSIHEF